VTLPHFLAKLATPDEAGRIVLALDDDLSNHLQAVRIRTGEHIVLANGRGSGYEIVVDTWGEARLEGRVVRKLNERSRERLLLVQGISKHDRMDQTIRQATEIGVEQIIPLECERATVRLTTTTRQAKRERWERIAQSAAEQSARLSVPTIAPPLDLGETLALLKSEYGLLVAWEEAGERGLLTGEAVECLSRGQKHPRLALFVGPEGGFSASEIERMCAAGAHVISLGPTILRTETAALVALALVLYHLGGLGANTRA
jgi:16S rRNA (uracil1498-N3)-methyltransferase